MLADTALPQIKQPSSSGRLEGPKIQSPGPIYNVTDYKKKNVHLGVINNSPRFESSEPPLSAPNYIAPPDSLKKSTAVRFGTGPRFLPERRADSPPPAHLESIEIANEALSKFPTPPVATFTTAPRFAPVRSDPTSPNSASPGPGRYSTFVPPATSKSVSFGPPYNPTRAPGRATTHTTPSSTSVGAHAPPPITASSLARLFQRPPPPTDNAPPRGQGRGCVFRGGGNVPRSDRVAAALGAVMEEVAAERVVDQYGDGAARRGRGRTEGRGSGSGNGAAGGGAGGGASMAAAAAMSMDGGKNGAAAGGDGRSSSLRASGTEKEGAGEGGGVADPLSARQDRGERLRSTSSPSNAVTVRDLDLSNRGLIGTSRERSVVYGGGANGDATAPGPGTYEYSAALPTDKRTAGGTIIAGRPRVTAAAVQGVDIRTPGPGAYYVPRSFLDNPRKLRLTHGQSYRPPNYSARVAARDNKAKDTGTTRALRVISALSAAGIDVATSDIDAVAARAGREPTYSQPFQKIAVFGLRPREKPRSVWY